MKKFILLIAITMSLTSLSQKSIHEFEFETLDGKTKSFADFKGKKILIFNAASECGYTPQYEQLQALHDQYGDKVVVIGFPANNYGAQEPGTNDEIAEFCKKNYGVTFTMAAKVSVNGVDISPIFKWLCAQDNPDFTGDIKWNFEKFILDADGKLLRRYRSGTDPLDDEIINVIRA
ncbi:glutathione peroxidase [Paracrocinitomix mangrovi]|uniref:glutathione peroxidase n=1 Tax=Paracrocinitomix mangrovi TaxID=2862509 RepID=UPI001C8D6CAC|nr:glutathione peroxidase [Paracrocinitomix mangrovi]UKN00510.1 glutathione peroxidase [Paracrocinitomix mangrovi]